MVLDKRETSIYRNLISDATELVEEQGGKLESRQIKALAGAMARQLAALESLIQQRTDHLA